MGGASTLFFNGRLTRVPGAYSKVDATKLESVSLTASGIVALLGKAYGGKPYGAVGVDDVKGNLQTATLPGKAFDYFREGSDLLEAAAIVFGPSAEEEIGGAQEIVFVKVNPSIQSTLTRDNVDGAAMVLTSKDWGYHTRQIKASQGSGTTKGKLLTLVFEGTTETFDDVGGDVLFKLKFGATTPAKGYTTLTAAILVSGGAATQLATTFGRTAIGKDTDLTTQVGAGQTITFKSSNAGDTTQTVTIYGTSTGNVAQSEALTCNGLTLVTTTKTWNSFHGAIISAAPAGTVTLYKADGVTVITELSAAALTKGLYDLSDFHVAAATVASALDAAGTQRLTYIGLSAAGAAQMETVQCNGATSVPTVGTWSKLNYLAMAEVPAARTATFSGTSGKAVFAGLNTLQKVADWFNGLAGYTLTVVTGETQFAMVNLDAAAAANCKDPAEPSFYGNLQALLDKYSTESLLVSAARGSVGTGVPTDYANVYLAGGHEGSTTPGQEGVPTAAAGDWQAGLNLLKKVRINTIVPLTGDPSVHAAAKAHATWMSGPGKSERDVKVGLLNAALTGNPTKTEAKAQIVTLGNRNVQAWAQSIERHNTKGEKVTMLPHFGACVLAGMQAGAAVGTPLTRKYINAVNVKQDSSWNPFDNVEEMLAAGLAFAERVDGVGFRVVRGVTTHLSTANRAYAEASTNAAVNYAVYNYRTQLETAVGTAGFAGTLNVTRGEAIGILGELMGVAITAWRSLNFLLVGDVLENEVEIAPVEPINFVQTVVHLVTSTMSASSAA